MAEKKVSVRLVAEGGRRVRAELEGVGEAGARGFGRLSREMELANTRLAAFARRAGIALGAAAAAATASLGLIVRSTVESAAQIRRFAQVANATPEALQRWSAGARTVGIEQEKLADILKDVNDRVGDFLQTGGGPMADFFENVAPRVGVTADQFARLSGPEALQLYVDTLERAGVSQQEMTFYLEAMASDATRLLPLLRNGGAEMARLGDQASDLGAVLDPEALGGDGQVEGEDDVPELPVTPVSVPGDMWHLGVHRLICGDSTAADVVGRLLGDVRPLLMVTDPPYGVEYDPSWRNQAGAAKTKRTGKVLNDDRADWREAWALFPGDVAYVWHGALHAATVAESLVSAGFAIRSQIIWAKDRLVLSRGDYHWQHEPCWYAVRAKGKGHWAGDRKQTTLWQIANRDQDADTVHGTQKPVECMRRPILNNSSPGQAVYEPFMGSGTTLIAAETTGRVCFGVELNPAYVDVAIERWQSFTGQEAVLTGTGETFTALKAKRLAA